ncbi:hypothetical protein GFS31_21310 [Leptolyngbya sp. BL0902]|uniref:hypothetical protein n=1 Tax=Leptolyngbya sp. BL0902 TaxID=1115757 RepID=UPI0018E84F7B|nr:hypothetical protein [Leptolyngbya sp. BL0902]QQE65443.1 hypothetical protein GFS31_21310 [Leptolyngbya sp. BL0902]
MDLRNPWLRLVGERLQKPDQQTVDYWRVEAAGLRHLLRGLSCLQCRAVVLEILLGLAS